jgi:hypothetical protein
MLWSGSNNKWSKINVLWNNASASSKTTAAAACDEGTRPAATACTST